MQTGLLWFDNDPHRALEAKVEEAATRYREKFGNPPNTCYVNQAALPTVQKGQDLTLPVTGTRQSLRILPARNILPHHFWIGIEEAA